MIQVKEKDMLCRAAYTFKYPPYGLVGIGYKCCFHDDESDYIECKKPFSNGWALVWWGPLAFLVWMYIIIILKVIKTFRDAKSKQLTRRTKLITMQLQSTKQALAKKAAALESKRQLSTTKVGLAKFKITAMVIKNEQAAKKNEEKIAKLKEKSNQEIATLNNTIDSLNSELNTKLVEATQKICQKYVGVR